MDVGFGFLGCLGEHVCRPVCVELLPEIGVLLFFSL